MNQISINSSKQIDENILNFIYGYYVKYDKLTGLINQEFAESDATEVNLLIDVGDILCKIESQCLYHEIAPSNDLILMAGLINLVAHYRQFFKTRYGCTTKIWLINSIDNCISPLYDRNFRPKIPGNQYLIDGSIFDAMCRYIPDVQYVCGKVDFATIASFIMEYHNSRFPYIILTKDPYEFQLCAKPNTWVLRPKKNKLQDISYFVNNKNAIYYYCHETFRKIPSEKKFESYPTDIIGIIMALTRVPTRGLKSMYSLDNTLNILDFRIANTSIPLKYPWDPNLFFNGLDRCVSGSINKDIPQLVNRFKAVDSVFFQVLGYKEMPESKLYNGIINLYDPKGMQEINERYFKDYPLDLEVL